MTATDSRVSTTAPGSRLSEQLTPAYAAALGVAAVSATSFMWLTIAAAVVVAVVGRRRPWVVAAAVVVGAWGLQRFAFLVLPHLM